jgi:hypothetical protein
LFPVKYTNSKAVKNIKVLLKVSLHSTYGVGMLVLLSLDGLLIIIKCLTVLPIGKWFGLFLQVSHSFYYLHSYLIRKEKEIQAI